MGRDLQIGPSLSACNAVCSREEGVRQHLNWHECCEFLWSALLIRVLESCYLELRSGKMLFLDLWTVEDSEASCKADEASSEAFGQLHGLRRVMRSGLAPNDRQRGSQLES